MRPTGSNIYPSLDPVAQSIEPELYQLDKVSGKKAFLFSDIDECEYLVKRMKCLNTITNSLDRMLVTGTVVTVGFLITAFTSDVAVPVG